MKELELVFEVLKRGPYGVETLGFAKGRVIIAVGRSKVLNKDETISSGVSGRIGKGRRVFEGFEGSKEVGSGNRVNCVAELVVKVPNFFENGFDFFHLHIPFHFRFQGKTETHTSQTGTPNKFKPHFLNNCQYYYHHLTCLQC